MQAIYAMHLQQASDITQQERFLHQSIDDIIDLYLIITSSLVKLKELEEDFIEKSKQKIIKSSTDINPHMNFVQNKVLTTLAESEGLKEILKKKKINNWSIDDSYLKNILGEIKNSTLYRDYIKLENPSIKEDKQFIVAVFTEIIAPNEKLNDYLEDLNLSWSDDIPIVNTLLVKKLEQLKIDGNFKTPNVYKDIEDKDFATQLFRKVILNDEKLAQEFADKTPNWDNERIAELDRTILKMAIAELLHFPSIPVKVTINEYVEIAKEYATPKSSLFINGILDKLSKEYTQAKRINKIGRGLL